MTVQELAAAPAPPRDFREQADALSSFLAVLRGGRVVFLNRAGCGLLGRSEESCLGLDFRDLVHEDDRADAAGLTRGRVALRLLQAGGGAIAMDLTADPVPFLGRPATLVAGTSRCRHYKGAGELGALVVRRDAHAVEKLLRALDVAERERVEEDLRRSEARLAEAQRIGHIGSWEWDITRGSIAWSDEMCRIYGARPEDFGGTIEGYLDLVHPDDRDHARWVMDQALRDGGAFAFEHRVTHKDGSVRTIFGRGEVFVGPDGAPVRVAGTGQDITERRRIEAELRRSEERFRNLCNQAPVMLVAFDPDGRVREVSDYWLRTMGYSREEIVGRDAWHLLTPESQERLARTIEENQRNHETVIKNLPLRVFRKDGSTVDVLSTSVAEIGDDGVPRGAICVHVDLTDLQRAEAALRESEERYRALVEHAPDAIMVLDVDTDRFVDANANAEKLFGLSREKLLTMGPLDFCSERQADGRKSCEVMEGENRKVLEGATSVFEFTHRNAQGREIACQTRLSRLPAEGRRLIRVSVTDITELKQLQEKVRHADRLAAAGVLAAGVAHEIGNPLTALSMAAQSLERRASDAYSEGKLALIREHIDRISRIVRQMSDLARPHNGTRVRCDVNQVVRRAVDMVRYDRRSKGMDIRYDLAGALPQIEAIEDELTQVCINLALNAFDAMAGNPPDRPRSLTIRSAAADGCVRVAFEDTGHGVPFDLRDRLFQPFFTTKEAGRGSGLGLSVSYRILEEHGGSLRLEDHAGYGARFVFELPCSAS